MAELTDLCLATNSRGQVCGLPYGHPDGQAAEAHYFVGPGQVDGDDRDGKRGLAGELVDPLHRFLDDCNQAVARVGGVEGRRLTPAEARVEIDAVVEHYYPRAKAREPLAVRLIPVQRVERDYDVLVEVLP